MKRLGNIYHKVYDIKNLKTAHEKASRGKDIKINITDKELLKIQKMLINKTYKTSTYNIFKLMDKGKERDIADLPYYPDRIIHWALMLQVEKLFISHFISNTYAAIPKRGQVKAYKDIKKEIRINDNLKYALKLDIEKFFPSIDKTTLKQLFRRKIKDNNMLWLLDEIVDGYKLEGMPIGNYTSQYFGNYYLSFLDHYIKNELRIKYYYRYMDDIVILSEDKEFLKTTFNKINTFVISKLKLRIKNNHQIFPILERGVDFVGYRFYPNKIILRNKTRNRMIKVTNRIRKKGFLNKKDISIYGSYNGIVLRTLNKRLWENHILPVKELMNNCRTR